MILSKSSIATFSTENFRRKIFLTGNLYLPLIEIKIGEDKTSPFNIYFTYEMVKYEKRSLIICEGAKAYFFSNVGS